MVIKNRIEQTQAHSYPVINMGPHLREMEKVLADFELQNVVNRIWHQDYTVWKPDPHEISNRLGWLQIIDTMKENISELEAFAEEIRQANFHYVVLLGMGGSSLGPEVLKQTFGNGVGFPSLVVLDSTNPAWVESVTRSIELEHTLFLVSSKSGTTTETMSLYRYFQGLVRIPSNFVAISDADTPLAHRAAESGFRRSFINPAEIGGRYSVLSYFGLVPAALTGIDIRLLLERATRMQESCAPCANVYENPGVWMGTLIGCLARHGHDKLTFIISPSIRSFGIWVEQLLAESTGKEGKGIIPVIDEPLVDLKHYGDDRTFIYLRMGGDNNAKTDEGVLRLELAGQPIIQLEINDQYDLGAEFFRWEMATAAAGAVLGINPFDQPDVQFSKDATRTILGKFATSSRISHVVSCDDLENWLEQLKPGNYLAIMAYLKQTPALDRAFAKLRKIILEKYRIATTLGYGPRFLHSTGQLHKGGPNSGIFLQITDNGGKDLPIPNESYTFGVLTEAEAQGDYRVLNSKRRKIKRLNLATSSGAAIERLARNL
jgi:glucose-6-phosphate isomerase